MPHGFRVSLLPRLALAALALAPAAAPAAAWGATLHLPPMPHGQPGSVGLRLQATTALPARLVTFGEGFARGALPPGATLTARIGEATRPAQLDVHATWPDGSARWASVTLEQPSLARGESVPVLLVPVLPVPGPAAAAPAATPAWNGPALVVDLLGQHLDLGAALAASTDAWLAGPLATQRRADLPVAGDPALHVVADATVYADGHVELDLQFRRDVATVLAADARPRDRTALPPLAFRAELTLAGRAVTLPAVQQFQYQDWHVVLGEAAGLNVQHDAAALAQAGLVPPYDLATGADTGPGSQYAAELAALAAPGWNEPLGAHDVARGMNVTGGRPDIGITTAANALWLQTQDDAARRYALGQADAGGAVPWHFWDARPGGRGAGRWMNAQDTPDLWTDDRGGPGGYTAGLARLTPPETQAGWGVAYNHQPNLDYVAALLTGSRYWRDMQQAQAMAGVLGDWTTNRKPTGDIVLEGVEVRQAAWTLRELEMAAALATPGSPAAAQLARTLADNWTWWRIHQPDWATAQGELATYIPDRYNPGVLPMWEQDYLVSAMALGARLGDAGAIAALHALMGPRVQSFLAHPGWNRRDGCASDWKVVDAGRRVTDWTSLAQVAEHHNDGSWGNSQGDYCSLARESLGWWLTLAPDDAAAREALAWLERSGAPFIDQTAYRRTQMMENVVPLAAAGRPD